MKRAPRKSDIPIFILAGGFGTRIAEESLFKPKPLVEIGGEPILTHIMRHYYRFGFDDFVILGGYRCSEIKKYFLSYEEHLSDLEIDQRKPGARRVSTLSKQPARGAPERWRVRILDTGLDTMTGGRLAQGLDAIRAIAPFEHFGLTYGDGLTDADLDAELAFHHAHGGLGTVLGVRNVARYGELRLEAGDVVESFIEKSSESQGLINGGFFFFRSDFRGYLDTAASSALELEPLSRLARDRKLHVYKHAGFWKAMDTMRDRDELQQLWKSGRAPWSPKHGNEESGTDARHGRNRAPWRRAG